MTAINRVANRDIVRFALNNQTAEGYGNMSTCPGRYGFGELPYRLADTLYQRGRHIKQTIYSYRTPIAWLDTASDGTEMWIVPRVNYSVTTSKHQGYLWILPNRRTVMFDTPISEYLRVLDDKMYYGANQTFPGKNWSLD